MPLIRKWYLNLWDNKSRDCQICLRRLENHEDVSLDHANPVSRGGSKDLDNCILVHKECNAVKGEFTLQEIRRLIESVNSDTLKILWLRLKQSNLIFGRRWQ